MKKFQLFLLLFLIFLKVEAGLKLSASTRWRTKREFRLDSIDGISETQSNDQLIPSPWSSKFQLSKDSMKEEMLKNKLIMSLPMFQTPNDLPILPKGPGKIVQISKKKATLFPGSLKRPKYIVTDDNFDRLYQKMNESVSINGEEDPEIEVEIRKSPTGRGLADQELPDTTSTTPSFTEDPYGENGVVEYSNDEDTPFAGAASLETVLETAGTTMSTTITTTTTPYYSNDQDNEVGIGMGNTVEVTSSTESFPYTSPTTPPTILPPEYDIPGNGKPVSDFDYDSTTISASQDELEPSTTPEQKLTLSDNDLISEFKDPYINTDEMMDKVLDQGVEKLGTFSGEQYQKDFSVVPDFSGKGFIVSGTSHYKDTRVEGTIHGEKITQTQLDFSNPQMLGPYSRRKSKKAKKALGEKTQSVSIPLSKTYLKMLNDGEIDKKPSENFKKSEDNLNLFPIIYFYRNGSKVIEERKEMINGKEVSVNLTNPSLLGQDLLFSPGAIIHEQIRYSRNFRRLHGAKTRRSDSSDAPIPISKAHFVGLQSAEGALFSSSEVPLKVFDKKIVPKHKNSFKKI
ncbi:unnamed protein product, partial [Mesorhabditis belari]|uniref:Uncharacterized protein n=1 Tax=Mesorhabditis belari TaxID=2138241 RepID=A0AAF3ERE6_9BILA